MELRPALVVVSGADNNVTRSGQSDPAHVSLTQWREATRKTLSILDVARISTLILRDTPSPDIDVTTCLSRAVARGRGPESCAVQRSDALREDVFAASREAAVGLAHVSWMDLSDYFCTPVSCPAVIGGAIVYSGHGHIANAFARDLAPPIAQRIIPLVVAASPAPIPAGDHGRLVHRQ
jgi:hypothetical protein